MLEIAAATAAAQAKLAPLVAKTEGVAHEKPLDWENWNRKDWTDELLNRIGSHPWLAAATRLLTLSVLATPVVALAPLTLVSQRVQDWTWAYALWGIEKAGPTFVKLAQWATTRHDLFSPEFCIYFGKLRDDTVGHAWEHTEEIIPKHVLKNLHIENQVPIGSGCIAQVYRGVLKAGTGPYPAGTEVAVKVQHPGIWHKVCVDFYIMGKVASFLESLPMLNLRYLSLVDTVTQFRDIMLPQLDLTLEANNLTRFNRDFGSDARVFFPQPLNELTSEHVLVETFMHGKPILEFTKADEATRKNLAYLGLETTLKMIFLYDFLHGDLHPGNILVSQDPKTKELTLHLLDCGITVEMGPEQHVNVVKILGAFTRQDGRRAGQLMVDASSSCQGTPLDIEHFVNGIHDIVDSDKSNNVVEHVGEYIADICYLACTRRVKLESSFVNAALAVEIMEGIASALYPDMRVVPVALPLVVKAEMMHQLSKFWQ